MELKEFLENNPIIVKSEFARAMYPNIAPGSAFTKLKNKLNGWEAGTGTQRMLPHDVEASKMVLEKLKENIDEYLKA